MHLRSSVAAALALLAPPAAASDIDGLWLRDDGNARVRIAPCGERLCATNVWVRDPSGSEAVGDKLVMTVTRQPDGSWTGEAYDPKRQLTVALTITLAGNGFTSRGCLLGRLLCRTVDWTAVR